MESGVSHPCPARGLCGGGGILAAAGAMLVLAGCGSGSSHANRPTAHGGNGVASKPPAQIVAAAQTALRAAHGFVVTGNLRQAGQTMRLQIVDGGTNKVQVKLSQSGKSAEFIALAGATYIRANQAYWSAQVGPRAASLANRWIELPASANQQLTSGFGPFEPSTLARCLGEDLGTLSRDGITTVEGRPAVVVHQAGNAPGSSPGTLAVAATGPAYPLRLTSTGPTKPGGKVDACNDGKGGDTQGTLTLSDFGHAPAVTAPKHPVTVGNPSNASV